MALMNSRYWFAALAYSLLLASPAVAVHGQTGASGSQRGQPLSGVPCPAADGLPADPTYPIRALAFDAIKAGKPQEARRLMRCAIHANSHDVLALQQEVYLDLSAGDERGSSEDIDALRDLGASTPLFEMQQGYIQFKAKRYQEARSAFERASATGDEKIKVQARKAIDVIDGEYPRHEVSVAIDGQYLNRFDDGIVDASARYFERIGRTSPFRVYAGARLLRDTASGVGPLPQIFSDNAFVGGLGIAFQPHESHYFVSAEANAAYLFYAGRNHTAATVPDLRAVAGYYQVFRPRDSRFWIEANGSIGFYSRYQHDGIAYLQPRESFDVVKGEGLHISPFFQQSIAFDTNQQFYNNTTELIPGVEASSPRVPGLFFRVEYVHGFYLPIHTNSVNPYGGNYNDFRFRLIYQKGRLLKLGGD
jgi:tetratricopeptide (TPR) repeat protein